MTISKAFECAILSEASYAAFEEAELPDGSFDAEKTKDVLVGTKDDPGLAERQAEELLEGWKVVDYQGNTDSGFSATLFESADDSNDEYVLAIRGTEPTAQSFKDVAADIGDIGANGIAMSQAIDMYNYYQRLITPVGEGNARQYEVYEGFEPPPSDVTEYIKRYYWTGPIPQPTPVPVYTYIVPAPPADGLGEIPPDAKINVVGHSLGGHLALVMSRLDPDGIDEVYTYNAPGFDTGLVAGGNDSEWFFDAVSEAEIRDTGNTNVGEFPIGNITNWIVDDDEVSDIGTVPGFRVSMFIEADTAIPLWDEFLAHSISLMSDALGIYDLFARLDEGAGVDDITDIIRAASRDEGDALEATLAAVGKIFGEEYPPTESAYPSDDEIRNQFYTNLYELEEIIDPNEGSGEGVSAEVVSLASKDADEIADLARGDIAYRYALMELNPFALFGDPGLYAEFNQNGELELHDQATGAGTLTDNWIDDRAAFLAAHLEHNTTGDAVQGTDYIEYVDLGSGDSVSVYAARADGARRVVFGSEKWTP